MAQRIQIPILILTGFLGSGKTSLLSQWLRAPEFEGAMVIVNELGEVGLDDQLVQHSSDVPLLLENGCACCEAAEDLNATLERLFWQRLHRQINKFNWVLIETTGIADPGPLLASLHNHKLINERYLVRGVATTFDARRGPDHLKNHAECRNQINAANAIILTKTDIASEPELLAARAAIHTHRPDADILQSARASLTAAELLTAIDGLSAPARDHDAQNHAHDHDHDLDHDHSHVHAHHAGDYTTAFAPIAAPLNWELLSTVLQAVQAAYGPDLLRLKGTAPTGPNGALEIIQAIAGEVFERQTLPQPVGAKPVKTGLTIISRNTDAQVIAADIISRLGVTGSLHAAQPQQGAPADAR